MTTSYSPNSSAHPRTRDRHVSFGEVVRAKRKALGLTQEQLADRAGCDRQSVNRVENAAYSPSLHRLFMLADALEVPLGQLLQEAAQLHTASRPLSDYDPPSVGGQVRSA